jgi:hypothetical protein
MPRQPKILSQDRNEPQEVALSGRFIIGSALQESLCACSRRNMPQQPKILSQERNEPQEVALSGRFIIGSVLRESLCAC